MYNKIYERKEFMIFYNAKKKNKLKNMIEKVI